jgi:hypothetical protein
MKNPIGEKHPEMEHRTESPANEKYFYNYTIIYSRLQISQISNLSNYSNEFTNLNYCFHCIFNSTDFNIFHLQIVFHFSQLMFVRLFRGVNYLRSLRLENDTISKVLRLYSYCVHLRMCRSRAAASAFCACAPIILKEFIKKKRPSKGRCT